MPIVDLKKDECKFCGFAKALHFKHLNPGSGGLLVCNNFQKIEIIQPTFSEAIQDLKQSFRELFNVIFDELKKIL
jgi:hypothetical protein